MIARAIALLLASVAAIACAPVVDDDGPSTRDRVKDGDDDDDDDTPIDDPPDEPIDDGDPETPAPSTWTAAESEMLELVNAFRARGGSCPSGPFSPVPPLVANEALGRAARAHSDDMADNDMFDHTGSDGSTFADRAFAAGYDADPRAENIAAGNTDAAGTFSQWANSDGHCRNMTSSSHTEIGVGFASGGSWGAYWTQVFGARR